MQKSDGAITREAYMRCNQFTDLLKRSTLTEQQKRTLRGQALHGDLEGARKGYRRLTTMEVER